MTETREEYHAGEPHIVTVSPRWDLTPTPETPDNTPLLDLFAADLVLETAVRWAEARNALAQAGKSDGNDLMRAYLDAEELHAGAVALYSAVTMPIDEDEECQLP